MVLTVYNESNLTRVPVVNGDNGHGLDDQTPTAIYYTVAVLMLFTFCVGTFFNGTAVLVFLKNKALRTPTNSFVLALCFCDLCMCMVGTPSAMIHAWLQRKIASRLACVVHGFTVFLFGLWSMYVLAAISIDRYVVIVRPLSSSVVTQRMASLAIAVSFLVALFWTVMPLLGWNQYALEGIGVSCGISWRAYNVNFSSYIFSIFIFCLILPLAIMAFCYVKIYLTIRSIARSSPWGPNSSVAQNNFRLERKMLKTVVIMIAAFLISWAPYAITGLTESFSGRPVMSPVMETFPALIAKMSCVWDPIVYIFTNAQFRMAFFDLCPCCETCMGMCVSDEANSSSANLDPESRAVLDDAAAQRTAHQHKAPPPPSSPPQGLHHDGICLEPKPEPGGGGQGGQPKKKLVRSVDDLAPVETNTRDVDHV